MVNAPIVTSRLLMDLADVANREDMTPRDPWEAEPLFYPEDAHSLAVLRIDGSIESGLELFLDPDWSTIAAYRFDDSFGDKVEESVDGRGFRALSRGRYRVVALHGASFTDYGNLLHPDARAHGVQEGGTGGRIIGEDWQLDRKAAERLAEELEVAYEAGADAMIEA